MDKKYFQFLLLISVLLIATCGLIYELVAGTLASYLLGDSVTQFSTIIGVYLFAMGIGSYLSRFIEGDLIKWFIRVELLVGLVGGFSSIALFASFNFFTSFRIILYSLVGLTGIFVGLEIPLLMRIFNEQKVEFKDLVSRVFTFDYLGALVASLLFPLVLVPQLGLIRTSLFFGMMNTGMALFILHKLPEQKQNYRLLQVSAYALLIAMSISFGMATQIQNNLEQINYTDEIVYAENSHYQRIVVTVGKDLRLYLNGNLQFSSFDEYRYHEALVHPAMLSAKSRKNVLILGGGDGMALREVLKYPDVDSVTLVDLDGELTQLFTEHVLLNKLNENSFLSKKLSLHHADAFQWVRENKKRYDVVVVDFPDPSSYSLGKLYSNSFYTSLKKSLNPEATLVIQSTSPFYAPKSYWCVDTTLRFCNFHTSPYHCHVPSFGEWGFILASLNELQDLQEELTPAGLRFFDPKQFSDFQNFPADMAKKDVLVNKLNNQHIVNYFEKEWGKLN